MLSDSTGITHINFWSELSWISISGTSDFSDLSASSDSYLVNSYNYNLLHSIVQYNFVLLEMSLKLEDQGKSNVKGDA